MFRRLLILPVVIMILVTLFAGPGCAAKPEENLTAPVSEVPKQQFVHINPNTPSSTATLQQDTGTASIRGLAGKLVFMSGTNDAEGPQLYTCNADGTGFVRLTRNSKGAERFPKWSPDGSKVAFFSDMEGNQRIYVIGADGSNQVCLTDEKSNNWLPCWSPDGRKIAFVSDRDKIDQIYIMNADGSGQTNITNTGSNDSSPSWSPDGKKIAFISDRSGNVQIFTMNVDGSNQVNISNNKYADLFPAWSPDGKKIVFQSSTDMTFFQIYVMNADGTGRVQLTEMTADNKYPAWSPDGSMIVFYSKRDCPNDNGEIYIMNADGTNQIRITRTSCTDTGIASWK